MPCIACAVHVGRTEENGILAAECTFLRSRGCFEPADEGQVGTVCRPSGTCSFPNLTQRLRAGLTYAAPPELESGFVPSYRVGNEAKFANSEVGSSCSV